MKSGHDVRATPVDATVQSNHKAMCLKLPRSMKPNLKQAATRMPTVEPETRNGRIDAVGGVDAGAEQRRVTRQQPPRAVLSIRALTTRPRKMIKRTRKNVPVADDGEDATDRNEAAFSLAAVSSPTSGGS